MRMRFTTVLVVLVALAAACGGNAPKAPRVLDAAACPADAKPANLNFTLKDTAGKDVKLADFKGKVLLLDFWATWCEPCKLEIPGFIDLYQKYNSQGLEVIGVDTMDDFPKAAPFAEQLK